jgi:hypothetical protein
MLAFWHFGILAFSLLLQADLFAGALFITEATQLKGSAPIYVAILILLVKYVLIRFVLFDTMPFEHDYDALPVV